MRDGDLAVMAARVGPSGMALKHHPMRRQRALRRQPAPAKHLVRRNAVAARHKADRHARLVGLRHD